MPKALMCINPITIQDKIKDHPESNPLLDYARVEYVNQLKPYMLDFDLLSRCAGSCLYCVASSTSSLDTTLAKDTILQVVDDAATLGVKSIGWGGGDPLLHPDWSEIVEYTAENGINSLIQTSGLVSKKDAKKVSQFKDILDGVGVHIDTINQEVYNQVHSNPKTLGQKIQGYYNLLEAGFPADKILGLITTTRPVLETIEETIDWYVDEMGAGSVCLCVFKITGFGGEHYEWEPCLSDLKRALEYRARKLGQHLLKAGSTEGGKLFCRSTIGIKYDGRVMPCLCLPDFSVGNIHQERLTEIFDKHRGTLLQNLEVKGYCGEMCENRALCFGCRANAYLYLGDIQASDPKCYFNPEAPEYVYPSISN